MLSNLLLYNLRLFRKPVFCKAILLKNKNCSNAENKIKKCNTLLANIFL